MSYWSFAALIQPRNFASLRIGRVIEITPAPCV
jgi:hypothetical protein